MAPVVSSSAGFPQSEETPASSPTPTVDNNKSTQEKSRRISTVQGSGRQFCPLAVVLVGLPARGKTVLAHRLGRYLNWTGHSTKVFSVSEYRRKRTEQYDSHDFFRADNEEAMEIRKLCLLEAMDDVCHWLNTQGSIAILDGTTASMARRQAVHERLVRRTGCKVLFVECICEDQQLIDMNIKDIKQNSPDYKEMSREKALDDFAKKVEHYHEQYETISPRLEGHYSYVKIYDAGEGLMTRHVDGHLESKVVYFLSSYRPGPRTLYFSRHGESENNVLGRIGGDADLSCRGRKYATSLAKYMNEAAVPGLRVFTSQLKRTHQTAAGIKAPTEHLAALNELEAGVCEGLSYEEMQEQFPQEFAWRDQDKLHYRYPWGESYVDIMARLEPVIAELEHSSNILVVSHQAVLRCLLGYFLGKEPDELPYLDVPLHTILKLTTEGHENHLEFIRLPVECVDTYRKRPKNCAENRSQEDALMTVPSHFDATNYWECMEAGDK